MQSNAKRVTGHIYLALLGVGAVLLAGCGAGKTLVVKAPEAKVR